MSFPTEQTKTLSFQVELASEVDACEGDDWGERELDDLTTLLSWVVYIWAKRSRFGLIGFSVEEV